MVDIFDQIVEVISDYRRGDGLCIDRNHIIKWVTQFGDNAEFISSELLHLLKQTYVSKELALTILDQNLRELQNFFNYGDLISFVKNCYFFDMQAEFKSQKEILSLVDELLLVKYKVTLDHYKDHPKKHFIYLDDVLATGGTIRKHINDWLRKTSSNNVTNFEELQNGNVNLVISVFSLHEWGKANQEYVLMKSFNDSIKKKILWQWYYLT